MRLGTEQIELSEVLTFELGLKRCVGVFQKGEVYLDTCYLLSSKEVDVIGQIIFGDSMNFNLAVMDGKALLLLVRFIVFPQGLKFC